MADTMSEIHYSHRNIISATNSTIAGGGAAATSTNTSSTPHIYLFVQELFAQAQPEEPRVHVLQPLFVGRLPLLIPRTDEVLNFHLLEFPGPENEVPRGDFVPKRFADLRDPKRDFSPTHVAHVFEVDENALNRRKKKKEGEGGFEEDNTPVE